MSYCVNCGVELGESLKKCPLCQTIVLNPNEPEDKETVPFFPTEQQAVEPVSKKEGALLITAMLASVSLSCALLNLVFKPGFVWSLFVDGAALMLWIWIVPPLLVRRMPVWPRLSIDVAAVAVYAYLIALASNGINWYLGLALPIIAALALIILIVSWVLRGGRHSMLMSIVICLLAICLGVLAAETIIDMYITDAVSLSWSLIVSAVCFGLALPLIVVHRVPSLREEVRRRFHM